jgi:hypothetical protein
VLARRVVGFVREARRRARRARVRGSIVVVLCFGSRRVWVCGLVGCSMAVLKERGHCRLDSNPVWTLKAMTSGVCGDCHFGKLARAHVNV